MTKLKTNSYFSVWDAITDTPEKVANLRLRSELMDKITALIQKNHWTQLEAAKHCSVTQPCINELLRGRISRFSLDAAGQYRRSPRPTGAYGAASLDGYRKGCFDLFSGML